MRLRNWSEPPFRAAQLEAVVLSHAHIDHSGYLPVIVKRGFAGPVYCTPGTADLARILLPDSGYLQEEEAARANRKSYSKHDPALPLYTRDDALQALELLRPVPYGQRFDVATDATAVFHRAGHIIGSSSVTLQVGGGTLVFSGDLGRRQHLFLRPPEIVAAADMVLVEATYGDRVHLPDPAERLAAAVKASAARGGALIIPAFAVGRTQEMLWLLRDLEDAGRIPPLPVYMDSPMALDVTELTARHPEDLAIDPAVIRERNLFHPRNLHLARTPEESKAINQVRGPVIIISASGMATGGRVLHHLRLRLPDPQTTVLFPGFQAIGTRGRTLVEGATEVRMQGQVVPVRARIEVLDGLSAHADRNELLDWLRGFTRPPRRAFVVHAEPGQAAALVQTIGEQLRWNVQAARDGEQVELFRE